MAVLWAVWYLLAVAFSDSVYSSGGPKITECRSPEQETFTCRWSAGNYRNLTERGRLKFFYTKGKNQNWRECPMYISRENSCYFNQSYTSETKYCVQLKSDITHHQRCFTLDDIVKPDAPVSLNWALLNISQSGLLMDIQLWWEDPATADISSGRIPRKFEIQYKARDAEHWDSVCSPGTNSRFFTFFQDQQSCCHDLSHRAVKTTLCGVSGAGSQLCRLPRWALVECST